jgi:hypothetical protein
LANIKLPGGPIVDCFNIVKKKIKYMNKIYTASVTARGGRNATRGNIEVNLIVKESALATA